MSEEPGKSPLPFLAFERCEAAAGAFPFLIISLGGKARQGKAQLHEEMNKNEELMEEMSEQVTTVRLQLEELYAKHAARSAWIMQIYCASHTHSQESVLGKFASFRVQDLHREL
eukprot:1153844-Pelagomonas_calceolata.AAC.2